MPRIGYNACLVVDSQVSLVLVHQVCLVLGNEACLVLVIMHALLWIVKCP